MPPRNPKGRKNLADNPDTETPPPARRGRRPKNKGIPEPTINIAVQSLFGFIAVATGHSHWERTPEQCEMVSAPLSRISETLEPSTIEDIQKYQDYALLLTGAAMLTIPSVTLEMQARKGVIILTNGNTDDRTAPEQQPGPTAQQFTSRSFAGSPQTRNGTH